MKLDDPLLSYAQRYRVLVNAWHEELKTMHPDRVAALVDQIGQLTPTNCGWWEYEAGRQLLDMVEIVAAIRPELQHIRLPLLQS